MRQVATGRGDRTLGRRERRHYCSGSSTRDMSFDSMASKLVFSPSEDEILLQEIQTNLILFDLSDANYKNIVMKDSIWKEISLKIGKSGK